MNRRILLSAAGGGTLSAALPTYGRPSWRPSEQADRHQVRREEVAALRRAVAAVRHGDSRYGGGSAQAQAAAHLLDQWALPLFGRPLSATREHELCAICAELARLAGWAALDTGRHAAARRHFDRALYWARAADDLDATTYVLATMALHATLYSRPATALDMIQGALGPAMHHASTRVLAFTRLIEARAHARASEGRAAGTALAAAERLLDAAPPDGTPEWLDFFTRPGSPPTLPRSTATSATPGRASPGTSRRRRWHRTPSPDRWACGSRSSPPPTSRPETWNRAWPSDTARWTTSSRSTPVAPATTSSGSSPASPRTGICARSAPSSPGSDRN